MVQLLDQIELSPLTGSSETLAADVRHRPGIRSSPDGGSLVDRGQEGASVVLRTTVSALRRDRDESGKVLVLGAESVERPRPMEGLTNCEDPVCIWIVA